MDTNVPFEHGQDVRVYATAGHKGRWVDAKYVGQSNAGMEDNLLVCQPRGDDSHWYTAFGCKFYGFPRGVVRLPLLEPEDIATGIIEDWAGQPTDMSLLYLFLPQLGKAIAEAITQARKGR